VIAGVGLLVGPWLVRMTQDLSDERLMRIRAQERAEVAAHVHDSVLHTLTLIQRGADDPGEVRRLARAQERELRAWLYKPESWGKEEDEEPASLAEAVRRTAAEVEDHHGVPIEVVVVGDCPLDEKLGAQLQAAREAMVNAAKYGGDGGPVQVYAEVEGRTVFVSVRDRGPGFDLDTVPGDRMGVRESIIGRMQRNGGMAQLRSAPDGGTVVELEMERAQDDTAPDDVPGVAPAGRAGLTVLPVTGNGPALPTAGDRCEAGTTRAGEGRSRGATSRPGTRSEDRAATGTGKDRTRDTT
jgi:two-component sensor histidine kinase